MKKSVLALSLSMALIWGLSVPTFAISQNSNSDNEELIDLSTSADEITKFNRTEIEKMADCRLICLPDKSLEKVNKDKLKELVDNGTILYADKSDEIATSDDLYKQIGVSPKTQVYVNGGEIVGYFISNQNNQYVPGTESVLLLDGLTKEDINSSPNINELTQCINSSKQNQRKILAEKTNNDEVKTQIPSIAYTKQINNYAKVYGKQLQAGHVITGYTSDSLHLGTIYISQYMYQKCVYKENGVNKVLSDVVSSIDIDATSDYLINKYQAVMHCNISNMEMIEGQYLETSASSSKSFSANLSGGYSSGTVLSGSVGASTSYTYTVDCQEITNNRETNKIYKWTCDPTKNRKNATWHLEPGVRIRNNNASAYKNQCYTSIQNFDISTLNLLGFVNRTASYSKPFEVGMAW